MILLHQSVLDLPGPFDGSRPIVGANSGKGIGYQTLLKMIVHEGRQRAERQAP